MQEFKYNDGKKTFPEGFGVSPERVEEILHHFKVVHHDFNRPKGPTESKGRPGDFFLTRYIEVAKTDEELLFVIFEAGIATKAAVDQNRFSLSFLDKLFSTEAPSSGTKEDICDCYACVARRAAGSSKDDSDPINFLDRLFRKNGF